MQACSKAIVVRLAPQEYRNLVQLATLLNKSLSDVVRESLCLPPESEPQGSCRATETPPLRLVGGAL
jgi:hypothetical protein